MKTRKRLRCKENKLHKSDVKREKKAREGKEVVKLKGRKTKSKIGVCCSKEKNKGCLLREK